jgi:hypothetical protein
MLFSQEAGYSLVASIKIHDSTPAIRFTYSIMTFFHSSSEINVLVPQN